MMSSTSWLIAFTLICSVSAFGKFNTTETVRFVQEDNQRDTISLLLSCFATLGVCVYSAVHLNVPRKAEPTYRTWLRVLKWCIIGLFAPELVIYTAWRQLASAWQLGIEVEQAKQNTSVGQGGNEKGVLSSGSYVQDDAKDIEWTTAHGFYATMGGFAIDLDDADDRYSCLFSNTKRLTLTARGVSLLAQCGHIPNISLDDIRDKNKTDGFAKLVACVQAGWMIVQVTARQAAGLPTTLLEIHTVAHVVCGVLVYLVWWHKPRHIESPTLLKGDWLWPLLAYMYMASRTSGEPPLGKSRYFRNPNSEMASLAYFGNNGIMDRTSLSIGYLDTADTAIKGHFKPRPVARSSSRGREPSSPVPEDEIGCERRRLAAEAVALYPALRSRFHNEATEKSTAGSPTYSIPYVAELVQPHSLDWPNAGLLRRTQSLVMGMVLWGASMVYGAIHVAAWDYFFPSYIEQLFWHLSSVWVTFCAGFWLLTNLLAHFFPFINRVWNAYNERRLGWASTGIVTTLCVLCGVSYIVSRTYLVFEAFVSIREVPKEVYQTPAWSQVFPHL